MSEWLEDFDWDSEVQKEGYRGFLKWAKDKGLPTQLRPIDLFFIQKDHESNEYWLELMGQQIASLQNEILRLQTEVNTLKQNSSKK